MEKPASTRIMDGTALADAVLARVAQRSGEYRDRTGRAPCLAVVVIGDAAGPRAQFELKRARCRATGIEARIVQLAPASSTTQAVGALRELSGDPTVDAVLLQLPVPPEVDWSTAFGAIAATKDVDGAGRARNAPVGPGAVGVPTCSAAGILRLLDHYGVDPEGRPAVVIGDDPLLARPVADLLTGRRASVTIAGSDDRDLAAIVRTGDIVVAGARRPGQVRGSWLKPGSVVVDAGYGQGPSGDVRRDEALEVVSLLAPVPGGVGPMTIAVLLERTVDMAERGRSSTVGGVRGEERAASLWPLPEGGEPACLAQLLCGSCGVVLDGGPHRPGCSSGRDA